MYQFLNTVIRSSNNETGESRCSTVRGCINNTHHTVRNKFSLCNTRYHKFYRMKFRMTLKHAWLRFPSILKIREQRVSEIKTAEVPYN